MDHKLWWKGALIYQIYPRSFYDSNGDGIGDLPGITQKLEYVASLGVDAIWIAPFFPSPMKDFGYDVADYCAVDPIFGNLSDFKILLARAHQLGLKVLIDQVFSHSSDRHPWFQQSRLDRSNPKADWYVWADPAADGSLPNNWLSIFGGPAWSWDGRRRQYYLHNFLHEQPDLNFHHPEVQQAVFASMRFWLDLGVDGFRLDVANFYFHSQGLENNPPSQPGDKHNPGVGADNPYTWQQHRYDISQPENLVFLQRLRAVLDEYPGTTSVGELGDEQPLQRIAEYTVQQRLHMAYSFDLLQADHSPAYIRQVIEALEAEIGEGWPCWALSNHDVERVASRWGRTEDAQAYPIVCMALLLSLRGSVCIYQGEELGLPQAQVPFERLQDPYGINFWPEYPGRDGCRTPFLWDSDAAHAGFSSVEPWLPVSSVDLPLAVSTQNRHEHSILNRMRRLIHWRQQQIALTQGSIRVLHHDTACLSLLREHPQQRLLVVFNFSGQPHSLRLSEAIQQAYSDPGFDYALDGANLQLPAYQVFFAELQRPEI